MLAHSGFNTSIFYTWTCVFSWPTVVKVERDPLQLAWDVVTVVCWSCGLSVIRPDTPCVRETTTLPSVVTVPGWYVRGRGLTRVRPAQDQLRLYVYVCMCGIYRQCDWVCGGMNMPSNTYTHTRVLAVNVNICDVTYNRSSMDAITFNGYCLAVTPTSDNWSIYVCVYSFILHVSVYRPTLNRSWHIYGTPLFD